MVSYYTALCALAWMALGVLISSILFLPTVLSLSGTNKGSFDLHKLLDFTVNGNPMEVVHVDGVDYYAKLTEFGAVAIMCD